MSHAALFLKAAVATAALLPCACSPEPAAKTESQAERELRESQISGEEGRMESGDSISAEQAIRRATDYLREKDIWRNSTAEATVNENGEWEVFFIESPPVPGGHKTVIVAGDGTVVQMIGGM